MRKCLLSLLLALPLSGLHAAEVSEQQAVKVAAQKVRGEVATVRVVNYEGQKAYFVVQFREGGWVLVSADDTSRPVIGYSPDGVFQSEGQPENFNGMMEVWSRQVVHNAKTFSSRHAAWEDSALPETKRASGSSIVEPLIKTRWNQSGSYQKYCPTNANGQAVVGCVAVGMAQAMGVAKWPPRPVGEFSYVCQSFGYQYINYDEEPAYDWNAILSGANSYDDVARLLWHCGVSIRMDYGIDGSGTQTSYIPGALVRNFSYPQSVKYYTRASYDGDWENLILTELREGRAVVYSGYDPVKSYGHCFNLDGYDGQWFHVNWGWGGTGNGYFGLDALRDVKMGMDYTSGQGVVVGVRPPSDKPSNITLSNTAVQAQKPAGTVVGQVYVESEAENPTYEFSVKGPYNVIFHRNMPAPFKVENDMLVTTEELSLEDGDREIEITATNTKNKGTVTREFIIQVTETDGIHLVEKSSVVVDEVGFSLSGIRSSANVKGLSIIRKKQDDGSVKTFKIINKRTK